MHFIFLHIVIAHAHPMAVLIHSNELYQPFGPQMDNRQADIGPANQSVGPANQSFGPANQSFGPANQSVGPANQSVGI